MKRTLSILSIVALAGCKGAIGAAPLPQTGEAAGTSDIPSLAERTDVANAANTAFTTNGRKILLNGKAFFVRGVDYAPTPICDSYQETVLSNATSSIWKRDLPNLRKLGANAIHVYNSGPSTSIADWLKAAYNGGNHPVYTILAIRFDGDKPLDPGAVSALYDQYKQLAQNNGANPDVMGISIGQEINDPKYINDPNWWKGLNRIAQGARDGFAAAGAKKIITTTFVDDGFNTVKKGEAAGYNNINVWGVTIYRGKTWGTAFTDVTKATKKPFLVMEWGSPQSYHPDLNPNVAQEFPANKQYLMNDYIEGLAKTMYANSTIKGGSGSGGFVFEWSDEWYKSGQGADAPCKQLPNPQARNAAFPGGFEDQAWFGFNSISAGTPNKLNQRPTFKILQNVWANQPSQ